MKILEVVLNFDYGGVETYAARISRALVELGHEVTLITRGGPLETLLKGSGVEVVTDPLSEQSLPEISERVAESGFDVLNAHNYNSGRVGCPIARAAGVPYVLTVHGPRGFLRRVLYNCWSEKVIATSGADKRGISGFMGVRPDNVYITTSAVDTQRYKPSQVPAGKRDEFLTDSGDKLILHVSRFSNRKAKVAFELINAMPKILEREPGARILIVGSGPMFDEIARRAGQFNKQHGQKIIVEKPRLDVSELFNMCDLVICTATTALEAMACGAPTIAAGRTGYFGPVDADCFWQAQDVLFADHGKCPRPAAADILAADILGMLDNYSRWRAKALAVADIVADKFSPMAAAKHVLPIYEDIVRSAESRDGSTRS